MGGPTPDEYTARARTRGRLRSLRRRRSFAGLAECDRRTRFPCAFSPKEVADGLLTRIQQSCASPGHAIAHLKIMIVTSEGNDVVALTNSGGVGAWGKPQGLPAAREATIIVNARISTAPEALRQLFEDSLEFVA